MSQPNYPIVNAGLLYVNGLALDYLSAPPAPYVAGKVFLLEPGAARDSSNVNDIILPQVLDANGNPVYVSNYPEGAIINGLQVGANGVDAAVLAASQSYAIYMIASSESVSTSTNALGGGPSPNPLGPLAAPAAVNPYPVAGLLSLNFPGSASGVSAPVLPFGYDMYRLIGSAVTNSSANIVFLSQYGNQNGNLVTYSFAPISVLSAGAATTFTAVSLASAIPSGDATQVILSVSYTSALAANTAQFLPYGSPLSGGTVGVVSFGGSVAGLQTGIITVPIGLNAGVPTILYKVVSGDALSLSVVGYR